MQFWGIGWLIALLVFIFAVGALVLSKIHPIDGWLIAALAFGSLIYGWRGSPP
jgi:hypothetical protein